MNKNIRVGSDTDGLFLFNSEFSYLTSKPLFLYKRFQAIFVYFLIREIFCIRVFSLVYAEFFLRAEIIPQVVPCDTYRSVLYNIIFTLSRHVSFC